MRFFVHSAALTFVALAITASLWAQTFPAPVPIDPAPYPSTVIASGDFNRDGHTDIVLANANNVGVFMGNSDGTFQQPVTYAINGTPRAMLAQDLNHDDVPDLVTYNDNGTVSILMGNADGTFQAAVAYPAGGTLAFALTSADFNGDGNPDLVVANGATANFIAGNGDGTFALPTIILQFDNVDSVAAGDFNSDGKIDLALGSSAGAGIGIVDLVLGNGNGTFQAALTINVAPDNTIQYFVASIAASDFNEDNKSDLAVGLAGIPVQVHGQVCSTIPSNVVILISNGDGTFQAPVPYTAGLNPGELLAGDLDLDGTPDLAVIDGGSNSVSILRGKGDGTFFSSVSYFTNDGTPLGLTLGDFNGDGIPDLGVPSKTDSVVLFGLGAGRFRAPVATAIPVMPPACNAQNAGGLAVADFDGDGKFDVGVGNQPGFYLGNAEGSFLPASSVATGAGSALPMWSPSSATDLGVADFDGDGRPDLVRVTLNPDTEVSISNIGIVYQPGGHPILTELAVGDFNNDGLPDIATIGSNNSGLILLLNNGDGTFDPAVSSQVPGSTNLVAGDFNGDGNLDLVLIGQPNTGPVLGLLLGNGDGTFGPFLSIPTALAPTAIALADLNNDGKLDVIVSEGWLGVLLGNGDGTFQTEITTQNGNFTMRTAVVSDFDGDGIPDVAVITIQNTAGVLLGIGDGTFQAMKNYPVGPTPFSIAAADINQDGLPDLLVSDREGNLFSVLLNQGSSTPSLITTTATVSPSTKQLAPGATVTLAAAVNSSSGTPGGTVSFRDGATTLGSAALNGSAQASLDVSFLDPGIHTVTAVYSGNGPYRGSTTAPSSVTVGGSAVSDFSFTVPDGSSTTAMVDPGGTATYNLSLGGTTAFNGTVTLTCSEQPDRSTCRVAPNSVTLSGATPVGFTVTVTTTAASPAARLPLPNSSGAIGPMAGLVLAFGSTALAGVFGGRKSRRRLQVAGAMAAITLICLMASCGGDGGTIHVGPGDPGTPPGDYQLVITGTSGSDSHTLMLDLTVR